MRVNIKPRIINLPLKLAVQTIHNKQIDDYIPRDMIKSKICTNQSCKEQVMKQ